MCPSLPFVLLGLSVGLVAASPPLQPASEKHWAVIVAGSNGWYNYRHQADACHAYQIVHNNGIPDEQIVVMMYDDLAQNEENPTPGLLINRPNGTDVYKGVPKDYTGDDVTPENFLAVLKGDSSKIKVYATTASNSHESSYACYYDDARETYLGDWYSVNWMEDSDVEDLAKETLLKQFKVVKRHTNTSHVQQFGNKTLANMKVVAFQGNHKAGGPPATPVTLQPVMHLDLTPSPDVPLAILKRKLMASNDIRVARGMLMEISTHLKVREMMAKTMRQVVEKVTGSELKAEQVLNERAELSQHRCYKDAVNHYKHNCFNWHKTEVELHGLFFCSLKSDIPNSESVCGYCKEYNDTCDMRRPLVFQYEYSLRHLYALVNLCERGYPVNSWSGCDTLLVLVNRRRRLIMGSRASTLLREEEIEEIKKETGFSHSQITRLYSRFTSLDKGENGTLSREDFQRIPELAINPLGDRIINAFFPEGEDQVNFRGFMRTLAHFRPIEDNEKSKNAAVSEPLNSRTNKLLFAFRLYDLDRDDKISRDELLQVLRMMVGVNISDEQLGSIADRTIQEADTNGDNSISFNEFIKVLEKVDVEQKMSIRFLH
ncbi:hypothetical protein F2P81_003079 [Scophthalmus maximus]|uniref:EF-hand domain-containing protein n=4 Tax=Percomorphaceae TaxID=1489872 RepID=A0A6A4TM76_SCOMX|nr:hypothetical protein F2P81_003079 [Scophthalmus maximus]